MKTLIIAEAGVNHNGDIELAKQLIDIAADCGADYVKFQTFNADSLVTQDASKAAYQILAADETESQYEMLRKLQLTRNAHQKLIAHSASQNIGFFSTGFDIESINMLAELGQEFFKIPSGEITNLPYLRHIGQFNKTIILSTGMSSMVEIDAAINALEKSGTPREKITILHCTTSYPVPITEVNLRAMQTIHNTFNVSVGYSDHTLGIEVPIAAVALGATVIEKHFTTDKNLTGPDHKASLEPEELRSMITGIRNIEKALGDGIKRLMPSEYGNRDVARKSIVASRHISRGEHFCEENLTTKRPGTGISPMRWDEIIKRKSNREYNADELIDET